MSRNRRDFLKASLAAGASGLAASGGTAADDVDPEVARAMADRLGDLVPPDGTPPDVLFRPSPTATPFSTPLFIPRVPVPLFDASGLEDEVKGLIERRAAEDRPSLTDDERAEATERERSDASEADQLWAVLFRRRFLDRAKSFREDFAKYNLKKPLDLGGPPDFTAHQRFFEFKPKFMYFLWETEFPWVYHEAASSKDKYGRTVNPWGDGSWTWGYWTLTRDPAPAAGEETFDLDWTYTSPGPSFHARYGEPILVRRINQLPEIIDDDAQWDRLTPPHQRRRRASGGVKRRNIQFALPSTTSHLHNAHTASESDGNPNDWINPGEYWDHHYPNFPSGYDPREKLASLWYHDHRMDFTAANVYAGLTGFYLLFDEVAVEQNTGDVVELASPEGGPPTATLKTRGEAVGWNLPSGEHDVPLLLHDVLFGLDPDGHAQLVFDGFNTDGILGDRYTVNRKIQPNFKVKRRKYRFRIYNGGPSRFYEIFLHTRESAASHDFIVFSGDGNIQPNPVLTPNVFLGVAQRVDFIVDFRDFPGGTQYAYLVNQAEQINGKGPTGQLLERPGDPGKLDAWLEANALMRFEIDQADVDDPSGFPLVFRALPPVDLTEVKRERVWEFDHDGGLWTINGEIYDPNRIDAGIEQGTAELWTFRNAGNNWSHPIHSHFTEHIIVEINDKPFFQAVVQEGKIPSGPSSTPAPSPPGPLAGREGAPRAEANPAAAEAAPERPRAGKTFSRHAYYFDPQELKKLASDLGRARRFDSSRAERLKSPARLPEAAPAARESLLKLLEDLRNERLERARFGFSEDFRWLIGFLESVYEGAEYTGPIPSVPRFMGGPRRDVAVLLPGWEIKLFMRWGDFLGKHILHCHNVVHEDHAMMIRWDIMPPGEGFDGPRPASEVYGARPTSKPHAQPSPRETRQHVDDHRGGSNSR